MRITLTILILSTTVITHNYGQSKFELFIDTPDGDEQDIATLRNNSNATTSMVNMALISGNMATETRGEFSTMHLNFSNFPEIAGYTGLSNYSNGLFLRTLQPSGKIKFFVGGTLPFLNKMTIASGGVGIGIDAPRAPLHLSDGPLFLESNAAIIIQSQNGSCWTIAVDNMGSLTTTSISCP